MIRIDVYDDDKKRERLDVFSYQDDYEKAVKLKNLLFIFAITGVLYILSGIILLTEWIAYKKMKISHSK